MFNGSFREASNVFQLGLKSLSVEAPRDLQAMLKGKRGFSGLFEGCLQFQRGFKESSKKFQESSQKVSIKPQGIFMGFPKRKNKKE